MEVELPSGAVSDFRREEIEEVLKKILAGMARGEVSVGGGQTRGLGRTRLEDFEIRQFQFDTPENTLMALNNGELLPEFVDVSHEDYSGLKIDVSWDSIGNVMSADGGEGLGVDTLPLVGLVDKDQIAVQASGGAQNLQHSGMMFMLGVVSPGKTTDEVIKAVDEEIEKVKNEGVTDEEFTKAKNIAEVRFIEGKKNVLEKARSLAQYHTYFGKASMINTEIKDFMSIKKEDLQRVAKKYFTQDSRTILQYMPKQK